MPDLQDAAAALHLCPGHGCAGTGGGSCGGCLSDTFPTVVGHAARCMGGSTYRKNPKYEEEDACCLRQRNVKRRNSCPVAFDNSNSLFLSLHLVKRACPSTVLHSLGLLDWLVAAKPNGVSGLRFMENSAHTKVSDRLKNEQKLRLQHPLVHFPLALAMRETRCYLRQKALARNEASTGF